MGPSLPPNGRRGDFALLSVQFASDGVQHPSEIMHYFIIPQTDLAIAALHEFSGSSRLFILLQRVPAAVELDNEFARGTGEIDDVTPDRMPAAKTIFRHLPA